MPNPHFANLKVSESDLSPMRVALWISLAVALAGCSGASDNETVAPEPAKDDEDPAPPAPVEAGAPEESGSQGSVPGSQATSEPAPADDAQDEPPPSPSSPPADGETQDEPAQDPDATPTLPLPELPAAPDVPALPV